MFETYATDSYNWLNADRAKKISIIIKENGGTYKRLAQERGVLNVCKIVARFDSHSYIAAQNLKSLTRKMVIDNGLTDSLTF